MNHLDDLYKRMHGESAYFRMRVDSENIARIRMVCQYYKLSLDELAQVIGVNPATLKAINTSEEPLTNVVIKKIARKYGVHCRGIAKKHEKPSEYELILEA